MNSKEFYLVKSNTLNLTESVKALVLKHEQNLGKSLSVFALYSKKALENIQQNTSENIKKLESTDITPEVSSLVLYSRNFVNNILTDITNLTWYNQLENKKLEIINKFFLVKKAVLEYIAYFQIKSEGCDSVEEVKKESKEFIESCITALKAFSLDFSLDFSMPTWTYSPEQIQGQLADEIRKITNKTINDAHDQLKSFISSFKIAANELYINESAKIFVQSETLQNMVTEFANALDGTIVDKIPSIYGEVLNLDTDKSSLVSNAFVRSPSVVKVANGLKMSQEIVFSGTSEDINKLKILYRRTFRLPYEIIEKENRIYQILYPVNYKKSEEQEILLKSNEIINVDAQITPVTNKTLQDFLSAGEIPPFSMWISSLEQRVEEYEATGKIDKIEDIEITEKENELPVLYKSIVYTEGSRVLLNPDGSEVPWIRLPSETELRMSSVNSQISYSSRPRRKAEEAAIVAISKKNNARVKVIPKEDPPVGSTGSTGSTTPGTPTADPATTNNPTTNAQVAPTQSTQSSVEAADTRGAHQYRYPNFGIWAENKNAFSWVEIISYKNYQKGSSARADYGVARAGQERSRWTLLLPEDFKWTTTHSWEAYKGWATPILEFANNTMGGLGKLINAASTAYETGKELVNKASKEGIDLASVGQTLKDALNSEEIQYIRFDQAKTYKSSNDRTISLDFNFLLGPNSSICALTLWNLIKHLEECSTPIKGTDEAGNESLFSMIPPDLFSIHIYSSGNEDPCWELYDCALTDISTTLKGPFIQPFRISHGVDLSLTFVSVAPVFTVNAPIKVAYNSRAEEFGDITG